MLQGRARAAGWITAVVLVGVLAVARGGGAQQGAPAAAEAKVAESGCCGVVTPAGEQLRKFLDGMDVEHLWLAKSKVNWETGEPVAPNGHTHCSAFAAAVAERLGIYMLRPPEHGQDFLASAQGLWFKSDAGVHDGWKPVRSGGEAQALANRGELVVLVYVSPDPKKTGHIAVVRPAEKSVEEMKREGPQTIQAGGKNFASGTAVRSFKLHKEAWPNEVMAFAHATRFEAPR